MKKVAIGCGIAALVVVAIGVGVTVFGLRWIEGQLANVERLEAVQEEMRASFGAPEDYVPPADGRYDPARIALFVDMRERLSRAGESFRQDTNETAVGGERGFIKGARAVLSLLNGGAGYLATADSLLLDAGMGQGEYAHLQLLWLHGVEGLWPDEFLASDTTAGGDSEFAEAFDGLAQEYTSEARLLMQSHGRNVRDAAEDCLDCDEWLAYVDEQLEQSRARRGYVAFTDPVPTSAAALFEEHRDALAATRPNDYGRWMMEMVIVLELSEDGGGVKFEFGD